MMTSTSYQPSGIVDDDDLIREPACGGIVQDYAQAMFWYRRSAEQRDAAAENNIGHMFEADLGATTHAASHYLAPKGG